MLVGGSGVHLLCSAQVKTEMKGMRSKWSTQRARRVSVRAVLAMHVPNLAIHTLRKMSLIYALDILMKSCRF